MATAVAAQCRVTVVVTSNRQQERKTKAVKDQQNPAAIGTKQQQLHWTYHSNASSSTVVTANKSFCNKQQ